MKLRPLFVLPPLPVHAICGEGGEQQLGEDNKKVSPMKLVESFFISVHVY